MAIRGAKKIGTTMQQLILAAQFGALYSGVKDVLEKAMTLTADALIFDLEDAVSPDAGGHVPLCRRRF